MATTTNKHEYQEGLARQGKLIRIENVGEPKPYIEGGVFFGFGSVRTVYRQETREVREPAVPICVRCHEEPQHSNHDTVVRPDRFSY